MPTLPRLRARKKSKISQTLKAALLISGMAPRRGKSTAPPPRKPETAAELAPLLQKQAVKLLERGTGEAANWPLIAEAAFKVAFDALDKLPDDPRVHRLLRKVHSGAENRITQNPAYERERFEADTGSAAPDTYRHEGPGMDGPGR